NAQQQLPTVTKTMLTIPQTIDAIDSPFDSGLLEIRSWVASVSSSVSSSAALADFRLRGGGSSLKSNGEPAGTSAAGCSAVGSSDAAPPAAWAAASAVGIAMTVAHLGHLPFLPAALSGTRIFAWQLLQ